MTGNICRCSNYNRYVEAVLAAAVNGDAKTSSRGAGGSALSKRGAKASASAGGVR
jgi:hypothetical protein